MARRFERENYQQLRSDDRRNAIKQSMWAAGAMMALCGSPIADSIPAPLLAAMGLLPSMIFGKTAKCLADHSAVEKEREKESSRRRGKRVLGMPPQRDAIEQLINDSKERGKKVVDRYLVGFELETGKPLYVDDDDIITHGCVFAKTGVGKTLWLESLMLQQMARGRASGFTFIDAKRDSGTLAHIILMALFTGRIEDLIVIDPFDPIHSYNFVMTNQRADVKARKVLRAGLPPTSDQSATKHYDRLAADSIYRIVRALESMGLAWSIRDVAVALSAFNVAYPQLRSLLHRIGAKQAMVELGHLAASYRDMKGQLDMRRINENLRGIASELHSISTGDAGSVFCSRYTDLVLTDAILRGKIIYFMLPRLEEAESAARMVKVFREDLEVSIGEITSSRVYNLEDPHLVIIDEGSSTFGPTWANLFELARKGRFALLFGAQSTGGLTDAAIGLSEAFYERVMANVNLKVMMRIGDNRTAMDMTEWIGKVTTMKKSVGAGITTGKSQNLFKGNLDFSTKTTGNESQNIAFSEDEEDLVSSEELKHEMAVEKGLAWFDLGDGRPVKGRTFWVNSELPDSWEGREFLPQFERFEQDEVGLADWVDEQIFVKEQQESSGSVSSTDGAIRSGKKSSNKGAPFYGEKGETVGREATRGGMLPGRGRGGATPTFSKPVLRAVRTPPTASTKDSSSVPAEKEVKGQDSSSVEQSSTGENMTQRKSVDNNPTEQDLEKNKDSPTLEQKNEQSSKQEPRWRFVSEEEALSLFLASQAKEKDSPQGKGVQAEKEEDRDTEERSSSEKRGGAFPRSLNSSQRNHQRKNGGAVANNNELSVQSGRNEAKEVANKKNFVPQEHDQKDRKKPVEEGRPSDKGREINQKRSQPPKKERFKLKPRSRPILPEEDPFDEE